MEGPSRIRRILQPPLLLFILLAARQNMRENNREFLLLENAHIAGVSPYRPDRSLAMREWEKKTKEREQTEDSPEPSTRSSENQRVSLST